MAEILVTGGTGTLGRVLVVRLREQGHVPRVLSRRPGPDRTVGDLETGAGIAAAVHGVDAVVHAATRPGHDVAQARMLLDALHARAAEAPHLVFVSIVGVDRVPLRYYRHKLRVEEMIAGAGGPRTVLRATQFHDLLAMLCGVLGRAPVLPVLAGARFQPVDVRDVAERLAELAAGPPVGGTVELGGPQVRSMADLARAGGRRPDAGGPCCPSRCPAGSPPRSAPVACSPPCTPTAGSPSRSTCARSSASSARHDHLGGWRRRRVREPHGRSPISRA